MKIILKEYLASLKERDELDNAVLPNLLSQMGLKVIETPMKGNRQHGVDVAAVGKLDGDNCQYLYLFCVKAGDVGRSEWDSGTQSIRPQLQEIEDVYVETCVSSEHRSLKVKICLCIGGELKQTVIINWSNFTNNHTTDRIMFELWNGDVLAEYMEKSLLARELLGGDVRRKFQKAIAMVNEPETCYYYTYNLLNTLIPENIQTDKERFLILRQTYICLHAICSWAIESNSHDVVYRITELGLLYCWDTIRRHMEIETRPTRKQLEYIVILHQYHLLYLSMSESYFKKVVYPHADKLHALSASVNSTEPLDVNLGMFDLIGRMAIRALWTVLLGKSNDESNPEFIEKCRELTTKMINKLVDVINSNPTLHSPFKDDHMIEIALVMYLAQQTGTVNRFLPWLHSMAENTTFALLSNSNYPTCIRDYNELLIHPANQDQHYRDEVCAGSVLYPYLFLWLYKEASKIQIDNFTDRLETLIPNCTHQAWFPDEETDQMIWRGKIHHGIAVNDISPRIGHVDFMNNLHDSIENCKAIQDITAIKRGLTPLFLSACRHYRMPIPPTLWITDSLISAN